MPDQSDRQQALLKIIKTLVSLPAQTVFYGSALLAIAALGGASPPGAIATLATTVGVNALSSILERVAKGEDVPDEEIRDLVQKEIQDSGIDKLVTGHEFQRAIAHVFHQFDLLKYATSKGEHAIASMLSEQFTLHQGKLEEILLRISNLEKSQNTTFESLLLKSQAPLFPSKYVDKQIEEEIERLRKSRYFSEFDRIGFSVGLGEKLISGDLAGGNPLSRCRGLAWCSRVLSASENLTKSEEFYNAAKNLGGDSLEIEIAHAFILSHKGEVSTALNMLAGINTLIARSAAIMIVANCYCNQRAIEWGADSGLEITSLDSDGKRFYLNLLLDVSKWDAALEYLNALVDQDFEVAPILHHLVAITYLLQVVPVELRRVVYSQIPLEVVTFPLASTAQDIVIRKKACQYFLTASEVAAKLNFPNAAIIDNQYALWLELTDPEDYGAGKQKLEMLLRDPKKALRYVNFGIQFGIKSLNLVAIEHDINQQVALCGGYTIDTAIARFALVYAKKPEDAAIYISQHQDQLAKYLDKKYLLSFQVEMFLKAESVAKAKGCLDLLLVEGISKEEELRIRRRISELEGYDAVDVRMEQFRISNSIIDLESLVDELENRKDWESLCEYSQLLFDRTHNLHDAERLAHVWSFTHNYERLLVFLEENNDLLAQSKILQYFLCLSLYYDGKFVEARNELIKLGNDWDNPNIRVLKVNLAISLGDWISLLDIVADELKNKDKRSAQELLSAAQLAINLDSPIAKDLIYYATKRGENDANVLTAAYFLASNAGWENEEGVFRWIEKAAELSGDDGPIQKMTIKDILDRKPEWDRRESDAWNSLSRGEIPIFIAAHALNKTLIDMILFPAITNLKQKDPRRRGMIAAYSGKRQSRSLENYKSIGLDATALLNLSFLNVLESVLDSFDTIFLPHSTLLWLFEEKTRSSFHQPSRIRDARKIGNLLLSGALEKHAPSVVADSELSSQVGNELAELIAEAINGKDFDEIQHLVVRPYPVHRITSLMEEEVELSQYASVLSSCQAIVEKLRQKGRITLDQERRAKTYLGLQEKQWPNQPEITDNAILYMDGVTVYYFLHIGILDKLKDAGFRPVVSQSSWSEAHEFLSFEEISSQFIELIEHIRITVNSRIQSGKIKIGKQKSFDDDESKPLSRHPTIEVVELAKNCDAIIVDDRFLNQHEYVYSDNQNTPVFTTLDLLATLVVTGRISDANKLEYITLLRRAGYLFLPVNYDELMSQLTISNIKGDDVIETAELKAMRESILRIRMSNWLQLPQEAYWLDKSIETFIQVLHSLWKSESELLAVQAKSNWIIKQIDIRGWAHRLGHDLADNLVKNGRGMNILLLLMPPGSASEEIRKEYLNWANQSILAPIKESDSELYSWILNWQKTQIAKLANMNIDEAVENTNE